ncbi:DNA adenine methylase [Culicoidibacter larvae]|uniref:DNA adenine methylase n=1 Tax=Culicoidibacter larvae TaxID=2579976 RepID=A0A5R8Q6M9_9FIRM|nr:DNA adenine methylase [Culicoidibacter larvae]TLG71070.1 DNA adenine methylase [Culicoidibacter larvae]
MKRILNYPGSKWQYAKQIASLMPDHKAYCEPFFGSGAVFFNKKKAILETINDVDGRLVNLFTILREEPVKLTQLVDYTLYSRQEYELALEQSADPLEDARRMLVRCWMGIGGKTNADAGFRRNISWNGPYNTYEWNELPDRLLKAAKRLKDAQIECKDALQLIGELDKDTLIYADPPYLQATRTSIHYEHECSNDYHIDLIRALKAHTGPVLLSGYDHELYNKELSEWHRIEFSTKIGIHTKTKRSVSDVLWLNQLPTSQMSIFE